MEIIVGKTAGFCYGVKRAVDGSIMQLQNSKTSKIYCLGEIVHNKQVVENLEKNGIIFIENINEVKEENSKVIVRAHGVEEKVYQQAKINKIDLINYTCPNVLKIHKLVDEYQKQGYYIFLTGTQNHPEVIGTISYCGKNYKVITNEEDIEIAIEDLKRTSIKKLLLTSQTTYSTKKFQIVKELLQQKLPDDIDLVIKNTICLATEMRQKETGELAKKVDAMIIIGGKNSSNTKKLYEVALENCKNTICIETKDEINKEQYNGINKIGIMAGASTPQNSIDDIIRLFQI